MKSTGHRCTIGIYGVEESGVVSLVVDVTGQYNRIIFGRRVFGISPTDLEECDLPAEGEDVGDTAAEAGYTKDDVVNILIPKLKKEMEQKEQTNELQR
jgi:hypothetical protein